MKRINTEVMQIAARSLQGKKDALSKEEKKQLKRWGNEGLPIESGMVSCSFVRRISETSWKEVTYFDRSAEEVRNTIQGLGGTTRAMHSPTGKIYADRARIIELGPSRCVAIQRVGIDV